MKLSDAIAMGRVMIKPLAGVVLLYGGNEGCAIGMALVACGKGELANSFDCLGQVWPWTIHCADSVYLPCECGGASGIDGDCNLTGSVIAHLFDFHIAGGGNRPRWTLDRLIDWVRSVEPPDEISEPVPQAPSVKLTDLCDECGHEIRRHNDKYGCEYERGDAWVEGNNCGGLVAQGPCGCTAWTVEQVKELEAANVQ